MYEIATQWDGSALGHAPVTIALIPAEGFVRMKVAAPFFNDPGNPGGEPGEPFPGLWDWEGKIETEKSDVEFNLLPTG